jgi:hypothetical protein
VPGPSMRVPEVGPADVADVDGCHIAEEDGGEKRRDQRDP